MMKIYGVKYCDEINDKIYFKIYSAQAELLEQSIQANGLSVENLGVSCFMFFV